MKYLNDFINYIEKRGYKVEDCDYLDGDLTGISCNKNENYIYFEVESTPEFEDYLNNRLKEEEKVEYKVDFHNYIVKSIGIRSCITTELNFFDGSSDYIYLVKNPEGYHNHGLDLFEKCLNFIDGGLVEHELFIIEKHIEHLKWAQKELIPLLLKADYSIEYSSLLDVQQRESSNLLILFRHYNESYYDPHSMYMETDCLTGECLFPNNLKLYGMKKEELWDVLVEEVWKKAMFPEEFSYLYTEGETKETYKELLKSVNGRK